MQILKALTCGNPHAFFLFNAAGEMVLQYLERKNVYMTPGGCLEDSESYREALIREVLEETGYTISSIQNLATQKLKLDGRKQWYFERFYLAKCGKCVGEPRLTEIELRDGAQIQWFSIDDTLQRLESSVIDDSDLELFILGDQLMLKRHLDDLRRYSLG